MADDVIGREQELRQVGGLLEQIETGPAALVFVGEPGIGKTTVWRVGVEAARASSSVLLARPMEAEKALGFSALADLFGPVAPELLATLPEPQRHALAVALLLEEPGAGRFNRRAVCAATLSGLRALASKGSVLLAIDDLQWMDEPSARAIDFALRRAAGLPIGVLASERLDVGDPWVGAATPPLDLAGVMPSGRFVRRQLGPLSLAALQQVLKARLGRSFSHRTLVRISETVTGNPFFALEMARSIPLDESDEGPSAIPATLRRLVEQRIEGLSRRTREALLVIAVSGSPTIELVMSATDSTTVSSDPIEAARAAGIVTLDAGRVRFAHPLFAAGVYWLSSPSQRCRVHQRLADLVVDIEARARHRALAAAGPDERLAEELDAAAEHARSRGALEVAADLARWAQVLTPSESRAGNQRRAMAVARYRFQAGQFRQARQVVETVLGGKPDREARSAALRLLGEIHYNEDSFDLARAAFEAALETAGENPDNRLAVELSLAYTTVSHADFNGAALHARAALRIAERGAEAGLVAAALAVATIADCLLGKGIDRTQIDIALRMEDPHVQVPVLVRPSLIAGTLALYEGKLDRCDQLLGPLRTRILDQGDESELPAVSDLLSWSACWRGDLEAAEIFAQEAVEAASRIGSDTLRCHALAFAALSAAFLGDKESTRTRAAESIDLVRTTGHVVSALWANWALAVLALSQGEAGAAHSALGPLAAVYDEHVPDPICAFFVPDEVEALIALGSFDHADRLLCSFEEAAIRLGRPWALLRSARCRALLLAAHGNLDEAAVRATAALHSCDGSEIAVETARTLLAVGQIERRRRRKAAAAHHLSQAAEEFERIGAILWAERARAELGRVGLRRAAPASLTISERRVADLVATGRTNRQVSAELFMSPKLAIKPSPSAHAVFLTTG